MAKRIIVFIVLYFLYVPAMFASLVFGFYAVAGHVDVQRYAPQPPWGIVILVLLFVLLLGLPIMLFVIGFNRAPGWQKWVLRDGAMAVAQITEVQDTGVSQATAIFVRLTLRVQPAASAAFDATIEAPFARVALPHVGEHLHVRFDPHNHRHIALDATARA